ncbi:hypothetical protein [Roseibium sp.]|uniref:hypothetical protein n=1 Tax=Roseibium sp. TaxID=1936156 RepID=UPI003D104B5F
MKDRLLIKASGFGQALAQEIVEGHGLDEIHVTPSRRAAAIVQHQVGGQGFGVER